MENMTLSPDEILIKDEAVQYANAIRTSVANALLEASGCDTEKSPWAMFMAGSPGAGKTEISQVVVKFMNKRRIPKVIRIDPDEFRIHFPSYTGSNSHLFQMAVVKIVERVVDKLLQKKFSFVLDGTFSSYKTAKRNVERALNKNYRVTITFVYQPPEVAWQFVCAREETEGRKIHKQVFVEQYFKAIETVNIIKKEFGTAVQLDVLLRNFNPLAETKILIDQEKVDQKWLGVYTFDELMSIL